MKKSINRNFLWSKFFVDRLVELGVRNVCISPGSRNTPLTTAFSKNKKIKKFVIVDERSSAFFALGLAKSTRNPVVIVTTSGTAVANLYPAVIEAFQSRIPLIVCTADRPKYLRGTGANQTINQDNLFANHIRFFKDPGLPELTLDKFSLLKNITDTAYLTSAVKNPGPVHLNFPFEKPLEESSKTDQVTQSFTNKLISLRSGKLEFPKISDPNKEIIKIISESVTEKSKGIIFIGWDNYSKNFQREVLSFSKKIGYPVLIDGASGLSFGNRQKNVFCNFNAFLRSDEFTERYSPEIIIQFGNAPTSNPMLKFFEESKAYKVSVNEFGDYRDPSRTLDETIKAEPAEFCRVLNNITKLGSFRDNIDFLNAYQLAESETELIKRKVLSQSDLKFESYAIFQAINFLPDNSNLFISNSLPIRDFDYFKSLSDKKITLFVNRGASGIDGINSTAAGIAALKRKPTLLITGDLSFFHDSNGLHILKKYSIPLVILLINNGGGAIFGMLPVAKEKDLFVDNFLAPLNIDFKRVVNSFNSNYRLVKNINNLKKEMSLSLNRKSFSVLEVQTDYRKSIKLRKDYFREVILNLDKKYAG